MNPFSIDGFVQDWGVFEVEGAEVPESGNYRFNFSLPLNLFTFGRENLASEVVET